MHVSLLPAVRFRAEAPPAVKPGGRASRLTGIEEKGLDRLSEQAQQVLAAAAPFPIEAVKSIKTRFPCDQTGPYCRVTIQINVSDETAQRLKSFDAEAQLCNIPGFWKQQRDKQAADYGQLYFNGQDDLSNYRADVQLYNPHYWGRRVLPAMS